MEIFNTHFKAILKHMVHPQALESLDKENKLYLMVK
jgi:hypothetical protein